LILKLSKMWGGDADEMPSFTKRKNFIIAFGWDASAWPAPAEEICSLLDKYHDAEPDEPARYLNIVLPQEGRANQRPSIDRRKRRKRP